MAFLKRRLLMARSNYNLYFNRLDDGRFDLPFEIIHLNSFKEGVGHGLLAISVSTQHINYGVLKTRVRGMGHGLNY